MQLHLPVGCTLHLCLHALRCHPNGQQLSTSEKQQAGKQGTQNAEAYGLYLKGRSYWDKQTRADLETAVSYFHQAIAKDPQYALALDPTLAKPHRVLGGIKMAFEWDFAGGEAEFKKALELDPNNADAHQFYADHLSMIGGREKEAFAEVNRAHQLDPLSLAITKEVGFVYIAARQFDEGICRVQEVVKREPNIRRCAPLLGHRVLGKTHVPAGP